MTATSPRSSAQGTPSLSRNGYPVIGCQRQPDRPQRQPPIGASLTSQPGFPGFSPTASQSLAYLADLQESGVPVTYGYISDLHERKTGTEWLHDGDRVGHW